MTNNQLRKAVKRFLAAFNNEKVEINDDTILSEVISATDGKGTANSVGIFKGLVLWTLHTNVKPKKIKFPGDWMNLSVANFSDNLLN